MQVCWNKLLKHAPVLADVSPAAGSSLMSFGSTGRGLLISASEGPLWGGTGKSSGWERSVSDSRPSCFIVVLPLLSSTMQSSCSSEAPSNTLLSSDRDETNTAKTIIIVQGRSTRLYLYFDSCLTKTAMFTKTYTTWCSNHRFNGKLWAGEKGPMYSVLGLKGHVGPFATGEDKGS